MSKKPKLQDSFYPGGVISTEVENITEAHQKIKDLKLSIYEQLS